MVCEKTPTVKGPRPTMIAPPIRVGQSMFNFTVVGKCLFCVSDHFFAAKSTKIFASPYYGL